MRKLLIVPIFLLLAGCEKPTAPHAPNSDMKAEAVGPSSNQRQFARPDSLFVERSREIVKGMRLPNGGCYWNRTRRVRIGESGHSRIVEFDPGSCEYVFADGINLRQGHGKPTAKSDASNRAASAGPIRTDFDSAKSRRALFNEVLGPVSSGPNGYPPPYYMVMSQYTLDPANIEVHRQDSRTDWQVNACVFRISAYTEHRWMTQPGFSVWTHPNHAIGAGVISCEDATATYSAAFENDNFCPYVIHPFTYSSYGLSVYPTNAGNQYVNFNEQGGNNGDCSSWLTYYSSYITGTEGG
jgi:hypothetical protein